MEELGIKFNKENLGYRKIYERVKITFEKKYLNDEKYKIDIV